MRRSRLLLPALGLALLTACQGRAPEPGTEPATGDAPAANKAADGSGMATSTHADRVRTAQRANAWPRR